MNPTIVRQFVKASHATCEYNYANKKAFHRLGHRVVQMIADDLGMAPGTYEIRSCLGGIAVSGEIILHSESLYICMGVFCTGEHGFYYRSCQGTKDYSGGPNQWMKYEDLLDWGGAVTRFRRVYERPVLEATDA